MTTHLHLALLLALRVTSAAYDHSPESIADVNTLCNPCYI
jgi:hypothetical protein